MGDAKWGPWKRLVISLNNIQLYNHSIQYNQQYNKYNLKYNEAYIIILTDINIVKWVFNIWIRNLRGETYL